MRSELGKPGNEVRGVRQPPVWSVTPDFLGPTLYALASTLRNSSTGVAVFDSGLHCVAINSSFSSMSGIVAGVSLGKTVQQMFGRRAAWIEHEFRFVKQTREILNRVRVHGFVKSPEFRRPVAEIFPLCDSANQVCWIGAAFCEASEGNSLRQRLHWATKPETESRNGPFPGRCSLPSRGEATEIPRVMKHATQTPSVNGGPPCPLLVDVVLVDVSGSEARMESGHCLAKGKICANALSLRELEVVRLLADGKTNKEIAGILDLSPRTIETYRGRLMSKLELHSVAELIRYAIRNQLIQA